MHMPLTLFICCRSRAADPTLSLARGPPLDEGLKSTGWEVGFILAPWAKSSLWPMALPSDGTRKSVFRCVSEIQM